MPFKNILLDVMHSMPLLSLVPISVPKQSLPLLVRMLIFQYNSDYLSVSSVQNHANN